MFVLYLSCPCWLFMLFLVLGLYAGFGCRCSVLMYVMLLDACSYIVFVCCLCMLVVLLVLYGLFTSVVLWWCVCLC